MILPLDRIIDVALTDWQTLRDSGKWATLDISPDRDIRLSYGDVLSDGTDEREIATRTYYMHKNVVKYRVQAHP